MGEKHTSLPWRKLGVAWVERADGGHRHIALGLDGVEIVLVQCDEDDAEQAANPGDTEKFTLEYRTQMCDHCRMNSWMEVSE